MGNAAAARRVGALEPGREAPVAPLRPVAGGVPEAVATTPLELSIVVPTLNESANVALLVAAIALALPRTAWEAIFVDDGSTDGTPEIVAAIAQQDRRVRLIRRIGRRGLSSAVIEGALSSTAPVIAVIDADLQHDEQALPALVAAVTAEGFDLAVGTRYAHGGSTGAWSARRLGASRMATRLAGTVLKVRLSDPMSGFFAVRRDAFLAAAPRLSGVGYKILLDLVVSSPTPLNAAERPYAFRERAAGESKLDTAVALEYLELIAEKTVGRFVPVKFLSFGAVGGLGLGVHLGVLSAALALAAPFGVAQALAVMSAMSFNFCLNNALTYRDRKLKGWRFVSGLLSFYAVCSVGAVANVGVGSLVHDHHSWWMAGVAGAVVGSVWNFAMGGLVTWRKRR